MGKLAHWAVVFAVLALIYAALGFGGLAGPATAFAKVLFSGSLILAIAASVASLFNSQP